jgi:hypothetical protein
MRIFLGLLFPLFAFLFGGAATSTTDPILRAEFIAAASVLLPNQYEFVLGLLCLGMGSFALFVGLRTATLAHYLAAAVGIGVIWLSFIAATKYSARRFAILIVSLFAGVLAFGIQMIFNDAVGFILLGAILIAFGADGVKNHVWRS